MMFPMHTKAWGRCFHVFKDIVMFSVAVAVDCLPLVLTCKQNAVPLSLTLPLLCFSSFAACESPSFGNPIFPWLRQACKGIEWQRKEKFWAEGENKDFSCAGNQGPTSGPSAHECDPRKLEDHRETNLVSIYETKIRGSSWKKNWRIIMKQKLEDHHETKIRGWSWNKFGFYPSYCYKATWLW